MGVTTLTTKVFAVGQRLKKHLGSLEKVFVQDYLNSISCQCCFHTQLIFYPAIESVASPSPPWMQTPPSCLAAIGVSLHHMPHVSYGTNCPLNLLLHYTRCRKVCIIHYTKYNTIRQHWFWIFGARGEGIRCGSDFRFQNSKHLPALPTPG